MFEVNVEKPKEGLVEYLIKGTDFEKLQIFFETRESIKEITNRQAQQVVGQRVRELFCEFVQPFLLLLDLRMRQEEVVLAPDSDAVRLQEGGRVGFVCEEVRIISRKDDCFDVYRPELSFSFPSTGIMLVGCILEARGSLILDKVLPYLVRMFWPIRNLMKEEEEEKHNFVFLKSLLTVIVGMR